MITRVEVITDAEHLARLHRAWSELLDDSTAGNPFLTWEWLYTWWVHLAGARRLRVVAVWSGSDLVAVAPLAATRHGLPWLSTLEFLGTGFAGSDYLDVIVRRGIEDTAAHAVADAVRQQKLAVRFDRLPPMSTATSVLAHELTGSGWTSVRTEDGICPYASLAGHTWQSYLATLGTSLQTKVRRCSNTLAKKFDVRFDLAATDGERAQALDALMRFHDQRWGRDKRGSTAFQTPDCRAFHQAATRRALDAGWLRLHVLRLNGDAAAVTYCFAHGGRYYLYQHGFNERFRGLSVGLVALAFTIARAIAEGALEFDMLWGVEPYKTLWARDERALERIDLYPADLLGRIHQRSVEARQTVRLLARRLHARGVCNPDIHSAGAAS